MSDSSLIDVIDIKKSPVLQDLTTITYKSFQQSAKAFARQSGLRLKAGNWLYDEQPHQAYLKGEIGDFKRIEERGVSDFYTPYVEKYIAEPGDQFVVIGDLHGDIKALVDILTFLQESGYLDQDYQIIEDGFHIVFLGDYTDYGHYGLEVVQLLFYLFHNNIGKVFLLRGDHEYAAVNKAFYTSFDETNEHARMDQEAFIGELARKFDLYYFPDLLYWYDYLPLSLYIGCKNEGDGVTQFMQLCHAGLEIGFNPQPLLMSPQARFQKIAKINRYNAIQKVLSDPDMQHMRGRIKKVFAHLENSEMSLIAKTYTEAGGIDFTLPDSPFQFGLGLQWNNFLLEDDETGFAGYPPQNSLFFGKDFTSYFLKDWSSECSQLLSVVNGHQHFNIKSKSLNFDCPMLDCLVKEQGCVKLWSGLVYTLVGSYDQQRQHSFVIIDVAPERRGWRVNHFYKTRDAGYFDRKAYRMFSAS